MFRENRSSFWFHDAFKATQHATIHINHQQTRQCELRIILLLVCNRRKCQRMIQLYCKLHVLTICRPGEQHLNSGGKPITNPFEEVKPRISEYTAQEIATLQSRLEKQLGPEYISSRAGPSGQNVHYLAAEKCIQLANEVCGFNGWSS